MSQAAVASVVDETSGDREPPAAGDAESTSSLDLAYVLTRRAILHAELKPGSIISQVQLARKVGVSRTPLREALRLLQREGLVHAEHNRRVRIATMSTDDLEELYALRITNETLALRLSLPHLDASDFEQLHQLLAEMDSLQGTADVDRWEVPHRQFHQTLVRHAGVRIRRLLDELSDHAERYRRAFITQSGVRGWAASTTEHVSILALCEAQSSREAGVALARHLARTPLSIIMHQTPEREPSMIRSALKSVLSAEEPGSFARSSRAS